MALFADAGQYADSMARLRECCKQQGIPIYYFSADAVNAGVDTGYAKQDTISGDDKHFGWRLGRFFLTGFTRVTADENQQPVFIQTLGDSVTLWFDLEQDIDALNGNAQLSLAADANGYDQQFGIPKTNFGRGTLIVRHTDYQNAKNEPAVYTDYLLAKGTTGANTRIVLHEEGDYEVALDYEVQDSELTHITSKFGNYRIFLRFSCRNGNCIVYPCDLLTGAELQNTAVAGAGFSLDLARSRYLDINVRRAVLVETANGVIEDERFNRPAKDGARYTFGIDPERTRSGAANLIVYKDHLYIGEYNDEQIAMERILFNKTGEGSDGSLGGVDCSSVNANLEQSVNLSRMDKDENIQLLVGDATTMFPNGGISGIGSGFGHNDNSNANVANISQNPPMHP